MSLDDLHLNLRNLMPDDYPQLKTLMDAVYDDISGACPKRTIDQLIGHRETILNDAVLSETTPNTDWSWKSGGRPSGGRQEGN